jgi:putative membrane protein
MKHRLAAACVLALSASVGAASGVLAAPSEQDSTWMAAAHQSNLAEIAAGQAAVAQGTSTDVKSLGQMFIDMHTQLDAELTAAAGQLGVTLPEAPTPSQQQSLERVKAETGAAFDAAWIADQIASHQTSLTATQTEISTGTDPTVTALATKAAPVVQQHLTALQQAASAAGSPTLVPTGDGGLLAPEGGRSAPWLLAVVGALLLASGTGAALLLRRR